MMLEMEPLYARFDAFVTAGMGEAPRIADYRSVSFWQKPSLLTAWNVTGQPVLALPNGFGRSGLPLGMQIVGRPFGEHDPARRPRVRAGHGVARAARRSCAAPPCRTSRRRPSCRSRPTRATARRAISA